jgi:periplasmic protein TonB
MSISFAQWIKSLIMRLLRLTIALICASLLFAVLPLVRNLFQNSNVKDESNNYSLPVIMEYNIEKEKKREKPVNRLRKMKTMASGENRASRSMKFSMRFTPDLSVGSQNDGVNIGGNGMGDEVYNETEVDEPARPVSRMGIEYPRRAKEAGIEGTVLIVLVIGRNGNVLDVNVESAPSQLFVKPVEQAVKRWKFMPAKYQGVAVQVRMRQNITFSLE